MGDITRTSPEALRVKTSGFAATVAISLLLSLAIGFNCSQ
jgi:hypothetical protein